MILGTAPQGELDPFKLYCPLRVIDAPAQAYVMRSICKLCDGSITSSTFTSDPCPHALQQNFERTIS